MLDFETGTERRDVMRYNVMKAYRRLCELYGWPQSFEGLRTFAWQLKHGYRSIWLGKGDGRDGV